MNRVNQSAASFRTGNEENTIGVDRLECGVYVPCSLEAVL